MSQDQLRQLFGLPADEEIFDDFQCKEGFTGSGRIYLTSGHMCYYTSLLGITKKLVISWQNITKLEKEKKDGIRVHKENAEQVTFTGFTSRDTSLKFIKRLWSSQSSHADDDESDEDDDNDADELLAQAAQDQDQSRTSSLDANN